MVKISNNTSHCPVSAVWLKSLAGKSIDSVVRSTTMNCYLFKQEFLRIFYVFVTQVQ